MTELIWNVVFAAVFAVCMGIMFNTRPKALPICFVGGAVARLMRDVLTLQGVTLPTATLAATVATTVLVLVLAQRFGIGPGTLVSAILPLGATLTVFEAVAGTLRIASVDDAGLAVTAAELVRDAAKSFDITLAIGVGVASGIAGLRLLRGARAGPGSEFWREDSD
jgi:uncharacterized membrane protein YjjB (DUF3815 family)